MQVVQDDDAEDLRALARGRGSPGGPARERSAAPAPLPETVPELRTVDARRRRDVSTTKTLVDNVITGAAAALPALAASAATRAAESGKARGGMAAPYTQLG
ncbi:hypothetical protein [Streptomyces sp. NPDC003487]